MFETAASFTGNFESEEKKSLLVSFHCLEKNNNLHVVVLFQFSCILLEKILWHVEFNELFFCSILCKNGSTFSTYNARQSLQYQWFNLAVLKYFVVNTFFPKYLIDLCCLWFVWGEMYTKLEIVSLYTLGLSFFESLNGVICCDFGGVGIVFYWFVWECCDSGFADPLHEIFSSKDTCLSSLIPIGLIVWHSSCP